MRQAWTNGIMGVLIGDALGNPVQFMSRESVQRRGLVKGMESGGVFNMPKGCWTDDGSMTLAALDSILEKETIDPDDIMKRFIAWNDHAQYTPTGRAYDQGITCMEAMSRYKMGNRWSDCGRTGEKANGNGGLMRIMPVCLFAAYQQQCLGVSDSEAVRLIHDVTLMTHNHLRACTASGLYYFICREILRSRESFKDAIQKGISTGWRFYQDNNMGDELAHFKRVNDITKLSGIPASEIQSSGYVIHTFEASLWCLATTDSFSAALLKAVNLGDDADTVGAVAGGLAGLFYGYESVPSDWKKDMVKREELEEICRNADNRFSID